MCAALNPWCSCGAYLLYSGRLGGLDDSWLALHARWHLQQRSHGVTGRLLE
jgi:hypothetical protein